MDRKTPALSCPDTATLTNWLEGHLADPLSQQIAGHTASCLDCERQLEAIEATFLPLGTAEDAAASNWDLIAAKSGRPELPTLRKFPETPPVISGYRIVRELGRGGMGIVYEAFHEHLHRRVALKVLPIAFASDRLAVRRFQLEAQSAAARHHSHIVPIFDVGHEGGHHYFAMQLIKGTSLEKWSYLTERQSHENVPVFQRVAGIGSQVARALQYAHAHGILHRDIKPSNLLLDEENKIWVSDFGLAKTQEVDLTASGSLLGTLRYMAPERFRGVTDDPRSDVYSLGATLYEVIAARPAFTETDYLKIIESIHQNVPPPLRSFDRKIPHDLQTVIHKCLEKQPEQRYATAQALADDLDRFLQRRPILARSVTLPEQAHRWVRRNPRLSAALSLILLLLLVGIAALSIGLSLVQRQAEDLRDLAAENRRDLYIAQMNLAADAFQNASGIPRLKELVSSWNDPINASDPRGWEWNFFNEVSQEASLVIRNGRNNRVVAWSPDGSQLAVAGETLSLFRFDPFRKVHESGNASQVDSFAWAPSGKELAMVWQPPPALQIVSTATGSSVESFDISGIGDITISPEGQWLAFSDPQLNQITLFRRGNDSAHVILESTSNVKRIMGAMAFSPDGIWFAVANHNASVSFYRTADWREERVVSTKHEDIIHSFSWHADSRRLIAAGWDGRVSMLDVASDECELLRETRAPLLAVAWSPNGKWIAAAGDASTVTVWDAQSNRQVRRFRGHAGRIWDLAWTPDSRRLASCGTDGTVRIWGMKTLPAAFTWHSQVRFEQGSVCWSPDGNEVILSLDGPKFELRPQDDGVREHRTGWFVGSVVIDLKTMASTDTFHGIGGRWSGRSHVVTHFREDLFAHDLVSGESRRITPPKGYVIDESSWATHVDGRVAYLLRAKGGVTSELDGQLCVAKLDNDRHPTVTKIEQPGEVTWHPRGEKLVLKTQNNCYLFDGLTLSRERQWKTPNATAVCWEPSGERLAVGDADGSIQTIDPETGSVLLRLEGHSREVLSLSWSPDGKRLASGSADGRLVLWEPTTGESITSFSFDAQVTSVAWSPSGERLAFYTDDGRVSIWSAKLP